MDIQFTLNGTARTYHGPAGRNVRELLQAMGIPSVRKTEETAGFCGSDIILLDGRVVNAGLLVAAQLQGRHIQTVESLAGPGELSAVQSALVDCGVVQSAYNAPAAALLITELLNREPDPGRADIIDALSCIFIRDSGYQQYFRAVALAAERTRDPSVRGEIAEEFREDLRDVGSVRSKIDGPQLVRGERAYVEDMVRPGSYILKMLRSPHAHAYIKSIDTAAAERLPGVLTVITHQNCPDVYFTMAGQGYPEPSPHDRRMFSPKVRHVGDRVAAVVAESEAIALQALAVIRVEYELLQPVFSVEDAAGPEAPIVQQGEFSFLSDPPADFAKLANRPDPRDGKIIYPFPIGADPHRNLAASVSGGIGDMEQGFAAAEVTIEREYETSQVQCTPCEPHTVYTRMEGNRIIVHASTQVPWHLRRNIATVLGISQNRVRVIKERVGGGYGSKQDILLEDVCAWATWTTGKPVFFQYTREEEFSACTTRHPMKIRVKLGAKRDGTLTAMHLGVRANTGPYGNHCLTVPMNACSKSLPLFSCSNVSFDVRVFYSNIFPAGAYQGYGAPQGSYALQTAVAELAEALGMSHDELLEKNRIRKGSVLEILKCLGEGTEGAAVTVASCGLDEAVRLGKLAFNFGKRESSSDPDVKIGKGMVIIQQGSGLPGLDQSNARATLLSDGSLTLHTGGADIGTGLDTVCAKVTAETLQAELSKVTVISGDTDNTPFDTGAYASSGTYFSGKAALLAAEDLKHKILANASAILGEPVADLKLVYPATVCGRKGSLTFREIAHQAESGTGAGQLVGHAGYATHDTAIPYGAHFCQVAVNERTGAVRIQKYHAYMDCGTPINPELAEGQVYGGVLKSIGHSLWEEMKTDGLGRLLNPDLRSYGVPMIGDIPEDFVVKFIQSDDPYGPFGAKSVSEVATNGAACVLAIAIHDAVGVWMRSWPYSREKILRALGRI